MVMLNRDKVQKQLEAISDQISTADYITLGVLESELRELNLKLKRNLRYNLILLFMLSIGILVLYWSRLVH